MKKFSRIVGPLLLLPLTPPLYGPPPLCDRRTRDVMRMRRRGFPFDFHPLVQGRGKSGVDHTQDLAQGWLIAGEHVASQRAARRQERLRGNDAVDQSPRVGLLSGQKIARE
jgi:hypothetical protein